MLRGAPTLTEHLYDDQGRLLRTVTASPWTPQDRALMQARQMHYASLCSGCGQPRIRAWNPDMGGWYEVAAFTCEACKALAKVQGGAEMRLSIRDAYADDKPIKAMPPLEWMDPEDMGGNATQQTGT